MDRIVATRTEGDRDDRWRVARQRMVEMHLVGRGIVDPAVLAAMGDVPRECFVPVALVDQAYTDGPLPIGEGQTISQPYIVALMLEAAELSFGARLLEIGTGSGYAAAIAARMGVEVWSVERIAALVDAARARLAELGVDGVSVRCGDGTMGWREHAPYDAIVVTAGGPTVPAALLAQLAEGGRLVMPVGAHLGDQELLRVRRLDGSYFTEDLGGVRFVPLVGEQGWRADES